MDDVVSRLRDVVSLLHEGGEAGDEVDWAAAAADLDVPSFPTDYKTFVEVFGAGSFEDSLFVSIPRPGETAAELTVARLPAEALLSDAWEEWQQATETDLYRLEDMLVWGETNGSDALCWVASNPDPNRWPVAVWARQGGGWAVYDCGMAEFIVRLLVGNFSECPLSVTTLWRRGEARFLNFREEARFLDEGVDPWTGESTDPFAGLD